MTNEKDKVLAHNTIDSVASSYRKSEKDGDLLVEARFKKLCSSFESALATVRAEEREAAFAAIGVELRRYGANIRKVDLLARFQELFRELEATENRKGEG